MTQERLSERAREIAETWERHGTADERYIVSARDDRCGILARAYLAQARQLAELQEALRPFRHALEVDDWAHAAEYLEGRDWDRIREALTRPTSLAVGTP